jgi:outer membrane receptor protein involved in Fe transport
MKSSKIRGANGLLCAMLFANLQAVAAENGQSVPSPSGTSGEGSLELSEVVVTAEKRSERLQDVPASVTAVSADQLASQNALQLQDYLDDVPGTSVGDLGFGRTQVVIRGISTGIGNNPTTGFTIDDVPIGSSTSSGAADVFVPNLDPADLDRVEVLRGPQGTLYGASSMGGLVKYVTADPRMNSFGGQVEVDGDSVDHGAEGYGVRGSANIPILDDVLAARASGFYRHDGGYIDDPSQGRNDVNSGKSYGGRLATLWRILPTLTLKLSALVENRQANASGMEDVSATGTPLYGDLTHERLPGTDGFESKVSLYAATLTAGLGNTTLTSITGYSQVQATFAQDLSEDFASFTPYFYGETVGTRDDQLFRTNKLSQEVRLASDSNHHLEWLVGGFYTRENSPTDILISPADPLTGAILPLTPLELANLSSVYKEYAGFGDLTYYFTDQFDLTVGGRYSHNRQDASSYTSGLLAGPASTVLTQSSDGSTTFLVTPRFRVTDSLMTYARVASGYRPGGANEGAIGSIPLTYGPDKTINYELGVKGDALERRFTYDLDVFYIDWDRLQVREVDPQNADQYYGNAGKATSRGAEVSLAVLATTGLTVRGNMSYTDAYLTENGPAGVYAPAGTRLPNSSKWSGSVSAEQDLPLTGDINGFAAAKATYTGDRLATFQNTADVPRFVMPSYVTVDLQVGAKTDRWTANLFLRNLTDRRGFLDANALNSVTGVGGYYVSVIQPRTVGLSLTTKF